MAAILFTNGFSLPNFHPFIPCPTQRPPSLGSSAYPSIYVTQGLKTRCLSLPRYRVSECHRSRVVTFTAIRLRGPGFKPRPGQRFENENFCFRRTPSVVKACHPCRVRLIKTPLYKTDFLSYPIKEQNIPLHHRVPRN